MKTHKGYYSIIQYCPDLSRLESANIGVLLFCPELNFLEAMTDEAEARVRQFFGTKERERGQVSVFRRAVEERLRIDRERFRTLADIQEFIARRANTIQLTTPQPVKVFNPQEDLRRLFGQLVTTRAKKSEDTASVNPALTVGRVLAKALTDKSVKRFVEKNVVVNVPAFHHPLKVPFGYQNGSYNLIQPVRFDNKGEEAANKEASFHAIAGQSIAEHRDPQRGAIQLTVVGQFAPEQREMKDVIGALLRDHNVKLFTLDSISKLVSEIQTTGKEKPVADTK